MAKAKGQRRFDAFQMGIEQVTKTIDNVEIATGLSVYFSDTVYTYHGLQFSNIAGISTVDNELHIELSFGPTIKIRDDGYCRWE